jgi:hypothetical protein
MVDIINELGTSGVQNAPVLKLFQSCHKMVERVENIADTWMQRSSADIEASDGQGYNYGLRMLFAFARIVKSSLQTRDSDGSHMKQTPTELHQRNRIALNRCRCKACQHLEKIKKHHLASLPLWLCEEYALTKQDEHNNLPHEVQERKKELMRLFSDIKVDGAQTVQKTTQLYCAPLFCFWPHCNNYEVRKIEIQNTKKVTNVDECRAYVSNFLKENKDKNDNRFSFIVSIHCDSNVDDSSDTKQHLIGAKIFVVVTMRCSAKEKNENGLRDMRWLKVTDPKEIQLFSMQEDSSPPSATGSAGAAAGSPPPSPAANEEFEFLMQQKPMDQNDVKFRARVFVSSGVYDVKEHKAHKYFHEMIVHSNFKGMTLQFFRELGDDESSPPSAAGAAAGSSPPSPAATDAAAGAINIDYPLKMGDTIAVALAESDDAWKIAKFSYLLDLLKLFRDDFGKDVQVESDHDENGARKNERPLFFKFNFCSKDTIQKWSGNGFDFADLQKQASRCVQCLWDQSITFLSDLPSSLREPIVSQEDKNLYETCRDTIAIFTNKIIIVDTTPTGGRTISHADHTIETAILRR